jgi:hypothetical protein
MQAKEQILIAISVESIQREPYISPEGSFLKSAVIRGASQNPELSFEMKTGLLNLSKYTYVNTTARMYGS